jgi:hypothetical protein
MIVAEPVRIPGAPDGKLPDLAYFFSNEHMALTPKFCTVQTYMDNPIGPVSNEDMSPVVSEAHRTLPCWSWLHKMQQKNTDRDVYRFPNHFFRRKTRPRSYSRS